MRERIKRLTEKCMCLCKGLNGRLKGETTVNRNSGSTLVIVLTIVAFLSILAVVVTSAAATNYRMKIINKQSQKAFYTSEDALDEIYAALGMISMETFDEAYHEALSSVVKQQTVENSTVAVTMSNFTMNRSLRKNYTYGIIEKLGLVNEDTKESDYLENDLQGVNYDVNGFKDKLNNLLMGKEEKFVNKLNSFLEGEGKTEGEKVGLRVVSVDDISISVAGDGSSEENIEQYTLSFTNCRVEYLNERSYYSNITFDGMMAMPDIYIDFSTETTEGLTTFAGYSLVGNTGISIGTEVKDENGNVTYKNGNLLLNGNAYAGSTGGVKVTNGSTLNVGNGITLVSGGDITVNNGTLTTSGSNLWCQSIVTLGGAGSIVNISGSTFVKDDIQVDGDFSTVTLAGNYYGYSYQGNNKNEGNHNNSSAIIVNGEKSSVNMTALNELVLGGRAYIDYTSLKSNLYSVVDENKAYTTGESVSLTGTQEMYLIPSYMMTREQKNAENKTVVTNVTNPVVGDTTGVTVNINEENFFGYSYLSDELYTPRKVTIIENGETENGKEVTYYYFKFKDDEAASDYVKALLDDTFYDENIVAAESENHIISEYDKCRAYIRSIIMANLSAQSSDIIGPKEGATVYTNGQMINAAFKDGEESLSLGDTKNSYDVKGNAAYQDGFILESLDLSNRYTLLSMILTMPGFKNNDNSRYYLYNLENSVIIDNESVNISGYEENNVFENIISVEELNKLLSQEGNNKPHEVVMKNIQGYDNVVSYITNGGTTVIDETHLNYDYGVIITTGDVIVKKDFTGSILAKGNIYIEEKVKVKSDENPVIEVKSDENLVREILDGDKDITKILNTGKKLKGGEFSAEDMTYKDFVNFVNWRKTENSTEESSEEITTQCIENEGSNE